MSLELDVLVAEKVMGWEWFRVERHFEHGREFWRSLRKPDSAYSVFDLASGEEMIWFDYGNSPAEYSTSILCSWLVLEEMRKRGGQVFVQFVWSLPGAKNGTAHEMMRQLSPESICRAALEAVK